MAWYRLLVFLIGVCVFIAPATAFRCLSSSRTILSPSSSRTSTPLYSIRQRRHWRRYGPVDGYGPGTANEQSKFGSRSNSDDFDEAPLSSLEVSVSDTSSIDFSRIKAFKGLLTENFAHPVDIRVTKQLSRIPFIEGAARNLYSSIEQALVVENLGSSVLVGPKQMPELYKSLIAASKTLDIDPPDVYVRQNPVPNAYTLAFQGKRPFIVIHTGLLDILNEKEVLAVIGHELGHLKCEHGVWITLLNLLTEFVNTLVGVQVQPLRSLLLQWQRSAEFTGDRASLLVTQDHRVVASVLMKLCGGSAKNAYGKDLNVDAFLEQAQRLKEEQKSLSGAAFVWANEQVATHPIPLVRAVELVEWYNSAQYSGLTRRARPLKLK